MSDEIHISLSTPGRLIPPNQRTKTPSFWVYGFTVNMLGVMLYYAITLPANTPDEGRDEMARQKFKENSYEIATKISEWVDQGG